MTILGVDITGDAIRLAFEDAEGNAKVISHKLAFLQIPKDFATDVLLERYKSNYVRINQDIYMTGDEAIQLSTIFARELYRPIKNGRLLNKALIAAIFNKLLEESGIAPSLIVYTVPAVPIDGSFDPSYRQLWLDSLLSNFCKELKAVHTSQAVSFNELIKDNLTGIIVDIGEETVNVACSYLSIPALSFSLPYGASYIDGMVAKAAGIQVQVANRYRVTNPSSLPDDAKLALAHYKTDLSQRVVTDLFNYLEGNDALPHYDEAVPLVIVGEALRTLDGGAIASSLTAGFAKLSIKLTEARVEQDDLAHTSAVVGALLLGSGATVAPTAIEDQSE